MTGQNDFRLRNQISHVKWPPIVNPWSGGVISTLYQMDQSQYWDKNRMEAAQIGQLNQLLEHAIAHSRFYAKLYKDTDHADIKLNSMDDLKTLPIVTRRALQSAGEDWFATQLPPDHGAIGVAMTSGSTGRPLTSHSTTLTYLIQLALVLRSHQWARRDTSASIAFINEMGDGTTDQGRKNQGIKPSPFWQESLNPIIETGPSLTIDVKHSVEHLAEIIANFAPKYLVGYPSAIAEIAKHCQNRGIALPSLSQIGCFGETLPQSTRSLVKNVWNIGCVDGYSAKELGPIALQCPNAEHLHIQSDAAIVEVLDEKDQPCEPGETGRLIITSLHNFAAPMIRYEIGDYAEAGEPCNCGRTLPVLNRILGRQRNLLVYPDGSSKWPALREAGFAEMTHAGFPAIEQFQIVQTSIEDLEVNLVLKTPLSEQQETAAKAFLHQQLGHHWHITFRYRDEIPRSGRGKFEDFVRLCNRPEVDP